MLNLKYLVFAFCLFLVIQTANTQNSYSHEIGVIAGPVQLRSDFGQRKDSESNFGNSGFGIGVVHYFNFSYKKIFNFLKPNRFLEDHFTIRNEISYNQSNLQHFGKFVKPERTSIKADQLRAHKGTSRNINIGTQIEFFPLSIRHFQGFSYLFSPFISFGVQHTFFMPKASTTFANPNPNAFGDITNPSNFISDWKPGSVDPSPGNTWSLVSSIGMRYKLDKLSDLMLDLRVQRFFSDDVDGLDHQLEHNKDDDWLVWLNIGYIYYLD